MIAAAETPIINLNLRGPERVRDTEEGRRRIDAVIADFKKVCAERGIPFGTTVNAAGDKVGIHSRDNVDTVEPVEPEAGSPAEP